MVLLEVTHNFETTGVCLRIYAMHFDSNRQLTLSQPSLCLVAGFGRSS